ncbi:class I SAM-dependent methyltransferase [Halostreptopolyspora alba]|uniref:Class I SAM-dependent methyltransferase n=1 Tax=Halostreptopolyspora alba TaxID=2487137 RepID=A0A3N0EFV6_9ACTN|nr:class I SAM-dependent methyltransferase [Nocardiopsaceae bacterium YIM 96095]
MKPPRTVLDAAHYWDTYYGDTFRFGQGTEHILDLLTQIPPVHSWTDVGAGSESLLWATALDAHHLTAVDANPARLATLAAFARAGRPRGVHRVALALCERDLDAFPQRCRSLTATLVADCLTPGRLAPEVLGADLITQFGLLGLCCDRNQFTTTFARLHAHLPEHGWSAGANWVAADPTGRVPLTHALYRHAARTAGLHLLHLDRIPSTDEQFPLVWTYLARRSPR